MQELARRQCSFNCAVSGSLTLYRGNLLFSMCVYFECNMLKYNFTERILIKSLQGTQLEFLILKVETCSQKKIDIDLSSIKLRNFCLHLRASTLRSPLLCDIYKLPQFMQNVEYFLRQSFLSTFRKSFLHLPLVEGFVAFVCLDSRLTACRLFVFSQSFTRSKGLLFFIALGVLHCYAVGVSL